MLGGSRNAPSGSVGGFLIKCFRTEQSSLKVVEFVWRNYENYPFRDRLASGKLQAYQYRSIISIIVSWAADRNPTQTCEEIREFLVKQVWTWTCSIIQSALLRISAMFQILNKQHYKFWNPISQYLSSSVSWIFGKHLNFVAMHHNHYLHRSKVPRA